MDRPIIYYEGDRIYFRPLEPEDMPLLERWINDPRTWATLGFRLPINSVREREWIDSYAKDPQHVVFGIAVRDGDRLIGTCGLHGMQLPDRKATFGLFIGELDARGNGYGSEAVKLAVRYAFDALNLNRVQLDVFAHNTAGIRAYEKAGFVLEGRRRQAGWRDGTFHDVLHYAVLRAEWLEQQDPPARAKQVHA